MLLSVVSVLVVVKSSSEIPEGLTNNPVFLEQLFQRKNTDINVTFFLEHTVAITCQYQKLL